MQGPGADLLDCWSAWVRWLPADKKRMTPWQPIAHGHDHQTVSRQMLAHVVAAQHVERMIIFATTEGDFPDVKHSRPKPRPARRPVRPR